MPTQLRERAVRKARKEHRCSTCTARISAGESYWSSTNLYDGRVYDWKSCSSCQEDHIIDEVYHWAGQPDEGVLTEDCLEWAEEVKTPEAERFLTRFRADDGVAR